jgi:hypothetical protein
MMAGKPIHAKTERKVKKLADWRDEAARLFGPKGRDWKFKCVRCGNIQSGADFIAAGMTPEEAQSRAHFSCIGRWVKGVGCDWTLGGLFTIHEVEVLTDDGDIVPVFDFAYPPDKVGSK